MSKIAVSMLAFLRTGDFGPIKLGISRAELQGCLGDPENWGPYPKAKIHASIWKYGDIEFHFHFKVDALVCIFSDHVKTLNGGNAIGLDPWVMSGSLTVKQALRDLEDAGVPCERIDWKFNDDTERFRVGAGVDLMFWGETQSSSNEDNLPRLAPADMTFNGFSYSAIQMEAK